MNGEPRKMNIISFIG